MLKRGIVLATSNNQLPTTNFQLLRMQLNNIFVVENVIASDSLTVEGAAAPHARRFHGILQIPVNLTCKFRDSASYWWSEGAGHVCRLPRLFGVDAHDP